MTGSQNDYIRYRLDRSVELFQDARLLAENKRWRSCVNRLYYSSFHLINALLFQEGINAKSHYVLPLIDKVEKFNTILTELIK